MLSLEIFAPRSATERIDALIADAAPSQVKVFERRALLQHRKQYAGALVAKHLVAAEEQLLELGHC